MYCCGSVSPLPQPIKLSPLEEIRFETERQPFLYLEDSVFSDLHRDGTLNKLELKNELVADLFSFPAPVKALKWDHIEKKMLVNTARNCFVFYLDGRCYSLPFLGLSHFSLVCGVVVAIVADENYQTLFLSSKDEYLNLQLVYRSKNPEEFRYTVDSRSVGQIYVIDHNKILRVDVQTRSVCEMYNSKQPLGSVFFEHQTQELFCSKFEEATVTIYSTSPLKNKFNWRLGSARPLDAVVTEIGDVLVLTILCVSELNLNVVLANTRTRVFLFNLVVGASDPKARLEFLDFNLMICTRNKLFNFSNIKDSFADTRTIELSSFSNRTSRVTKPERYLSISNHVMQKMIDNQLLQVDHFERVLKAETPVVSCFKCFARPRKVRHLPCEHVLLCPQCFQKEAGLQKCCYFCQNQIESTSSST